jgi:RNA polymerase sigma factor (sigma-70 family)
MDADQSAPDVDPPEYPELLPVHERFPKLYHELLGIAEKQLKRWRANSLSPLDLAHDAFLQLLEEEKLRQARDRSSLGEKPDYMFRACFGQACVTILRRRYARRVRHQKALRELSLQVDGLPRTDFSELNELLLQLRDLDSLKATILELQIFGGMQNAECAELLQVSKSYVTRRRTEAIAWLRSRLADRGQGESPSGSLKTNH